MDREGESKTDVKKYNYAQKIHIRFMSLTKNIFDNKELGK